MALLCIRPCCWSGRPALARRQSPPGQTLLCLSGEGSPGEGGAGSVQVPGEQLRPPRRVARPCPSSCCGHRVPLASAQRSDQVPASGLHEAQGCGPGRKQLCRHRESCRPAGQELLAPSGCFLDGLPGPEASGPRSSFLCFQDPGGAGQTLPTQDKAPHRHHLGPRDGSRPADGTVLLS